MPGWLSVSANCLLNSQAAACHVCAGPDNVKVLLGFSGTILNMVSLGSLRRKLQAQGLSDMEHEVMAMLRAYQSCTKLPNRDSWEGLDGMLNTDLAENIYTKMAKALPPEAPSSMAELQNYFPLPPV